MKYLFKLLLLVFLVSLTTTIYSQIKDTLYIPKSNLEYRDSMYIENNTRVIVTNIITEPMFVGGGKAWQLFLAKNLNESIPYDLNAPNGEYIVQLYFDVDKNGNISNIKARENIGYGMVEESIRVLKKSPKWASAKLNGKKINCRCKRAFQFNIHVVY
jgi:hypothetical protein